MRNPFTRLNAVSGVRKKLYNSSFDKFLKEVNENDMDFTTIILYNEVKENKKVSFIGKYENFEEDLKKYLKK